jgi:large subunit ribosomal protein L25
METPTLAASIRTALGNRAKDVMKEQKIPAIVYGHGVDARSISVPASDFRRVFMKAGSSTLIDLAVDAAPPVKVLIKEVQYHPTRPQPIHIDFLQVRMTEKMSVTIPLVFIGESEAVKVLGGTLMKAMDHVDIECLPADIPHEVTVDISVLNTFDDAITVADLKLPKGVEVTTHSELTIAFVEKPMTEEELKKMEESQIGDVAAVKAEAEEKKEEKAVEGAAVKEGNAT